MAKEVTGEIEYVGKGMADQINASHDEVVQSAVGACMAAVRTGHLLLEVKQSLPHGQFGDWVEKWCKFSDRQARRYMGSVRTLGGKGKTDIMSVLNDDVNVRRLLPSENGKSKNCQNSQDEIPHIEGLSEDVSGLVDSGQLDVGEEELAELASNYEEERQEALAQSVVEGRQSMREALDSGEVPEPTIEELISEQSKEVEKFCRDVMKDFKDKMPDSPWITEHYGGAKSHVEKLRSVLTTIRLGKCTEICPTCGGEGDGCKDCFQTGMMPKMVRTQM